MSSVGHSFDRDDTFVNNYEPQHIGIEDDDYDDDTELQAAQSDSKYLNYYLFCGC